MTSHGTAANHCPVCGTLSVYTNGQGACSLRCAFQVAKLRHREFSVSLNDALAAVEHEFKSWGLPDKPTPNDRYRYRYVKVREQFTSRYWKIDRALLLDAGLNVEYTWVGQGRNRHRIYRFSPQAMKALPEFMADYKVRSFSDDDMNYIEAFWEPYWHFLPAPEKS